jgi:hypothetical protein
MRSFIYSQAEINYIGVPPFKRITIERIVLLFLIFFCKLLCAQSDNYYTIIGEIDLWNYSEYPDFPPYSDLDSAIIKIREYDLCSIPDSCFFSISTLRESSQKQYTIPGKQHLLINEVVKDGRGISICILKYKRSQIDSMKIYFVGKNENGYRLNTNYSQGTFLIQQSMFKEEKNDPYLHLTMGGYLPYQKKDENSNILYENYYDWNAKYTETEGLFDITGKKVGLWKYNEPKYGSLKVSYEFKNNKLNGESKIYRNDGSAMSVYFVNDKPVASNASDILSNDFFFNLALDFIDSSLFYVYNEILRIKLISIKENLLYRTADSSLITISNKILTAIKNNNFDELSNYIQPNIGIRFSPYSYVDVNKDLRLNKDQLMKYSKSQKQIFWGKYDGTGDTIKLSVSDYFKKFVYDSDFLKADQKSINKTLVHGNLPTNLQDVYRQNDFVEFYFPGSDTNNFMDWRSLRLVFKKENRHYYLIAIIHDQQTI